MNIMKEAHKLTKEIKREFPNVDYKGQLGICISYLYKEGGKVRNLIGSEKQIKWANDILDKMEKLENDAVAVAIKNKDKLNIEHLKIWIHYDENITKASEIIDKYSYLSRKETGESLESKFPVFVYVDYPEELKKAKKKYIK